MQVNQANAAAVAAIFDRLADARFTMRTIPAIKKADLVPGVAEMEAALIVNVAAEIGCPIRRRIADAALLIERPVSMDVAGARELADKAKAVLEAGAEPFEADYLPTLTSLDLALDGTLDAEEGEDDGDEPTGETMH